MLACLADVGDPVLAGCPLPVMQPPDYRPMTKGVHPTRLAWEIICKDPGAPNPQELGVPGQALSVSQWPGRGRTQAPQLACTEPSLVTRARTAEPWQGSSPASGLLTGVG